MWISRIRATGGFLAGLDLELRPGLNVVVGPRGSGKTTLLELIRHALGLAESSSVGRPALMKHALGAGEVVIDLELEHGSQRLIVDANGGGRQPGLTGAAAVMLGQNELEGLADDARRRLALLDVRAGLAAPATEEHFEDLGALSRRRLSLTERNEELQDRLRARQSLAFDRERLAVIERDLLSQVSSELTAKRQQLASVEARLLATQQVQDTSGTIRESLRQADDLAAEIVRLAEAVGVSAPSQLQALVADMRNALEMAATDIRGVISGFSERALQEAVSSRESELSLRAQAEPLRAELEEAEQGLGSTTAQLRNIDAQLAKLNELEQEAAHGDREIRALDERRAGLLTLAEDASEQLFGARSRAAREITEALSHRVQVTVQHLGDTADFADVLSASLQGSGLKYGALSESLSRDVLPVLLLRYVEDNDVEGFAAAAGLPPSRAERVLSALRTEDGVAGIARTHLEDEVDFKLQDGSQLKSASELSTGQKCAATLPIVLTDNSRLVILDQPEDHLDNLFLVSTVVFSLVHRADEGAQTIVATHNPNIPVLGSATQVAYFKSDGVNGALAAVGPYDAADIVSVITNLMEGGQQAFDARAEFYRSHGV